MTSATVVGKVSSKVFTVRIDSGWTATVKASSEVARELRIGQHVRLELDADRSHRRVGDAR